jgi:lipopolysaccharide export system permease protein
MIYSFFGLIDRYIIRQFLFGFSFTLILIISIAITTDLGEHIDKFVIHKLSVKYVISEFYINFIPYIIAY